MAASSGDSALSPEVAAVEFDCDEAAYDHGLDRGISVSGEGRDHFARGRVALLAACLARLGERPRAVLDFGCGSGSTSPILRDLLGAREVVGVDVSRRLLESARRHASRGLVFVAREDLRADVRLDLAYCNGVFHHIQERERPESVRYVWSALRPGGLFALWENNPWSPAARYVMSRIPFDRDARMVYPHAARRMLRAHGFEIVRSDFLFIFPRRLSSLRVLEEPLSQLPLGAQYQVLARKV